MEITPFQRFILINLHNLWKEYGTSKVKSLEALVEEYDYKEKNIRKPMKALISAGLVDSDSYSAWLTKKRVLVKWKRPAVPTTVQIPKKIKCLSASQSIFSKTLNRQSENPNYSHLKERCGCTV